ncbi:putative bZIP transcription factor (MetR) [Aspergillus homomorphus CBS 101889]|uniref:BZIP domain-containing protein n=1 Tax=Aspergillus homomorphus (strain CBS 101889) TaxID=1450537 RepID=A0A395I969_ASPHC|nr:hypothetical protein BO97DRAFT_402899 [Aspergillus homomorphus CBS 101889]RAL16505.1 hypothetical protein BO97DRAFT_402899 [Aspergillus homomorphus CBS 101889]
MSEYNGRPAPNFSQYLEDLNAIPSPYDQAVQQQQQDSYNFDADLSLFTNTEFFDFDHFGDINLPAFDSVDETTVKKEATQNANSDMDFLNLLGGFGNVNDIPPSNANAVNAQPMPPRNQQFAALPPLPNAPFNANPAPSQASSQHSPQSLASMSSPAATAATTNAPSTSTTAPKRKNTQKAPHMSVEEVARIAAEEDKRRRNTAASARFRVKKKMREQALEKTVKETTEKNTALEARVTALELENQWLKNLITEKNGQTSEEAKKSENDIAIMFQKFLASQQKDSERSSSDSNIGVGTA